MYAKFFKRLIDIVLSGVALIVLFPVLLILTVVGAIKMKGNPFFTQERPGKDEKIFKLLKFRSMTCEKDKDGKLLPDDVRLTRYGRILRSTSLDELPELINIFIGNMSIVGPRPLLVEYLPYYTEEERHRHDVRPGLTGWAQVNGRNSVDWETRFRLDVEYVRRISLMMDIKIDRTKEIESLVVADGLTDYSLDGYDIEFKDVDFNYDDLKNVLTDISFTAKQGEVTALVGPSGGGKSTVSKLAARFWDPVSGEVSLGGQNLSNLDCEKLLENFSIVFQDVILFNNSILENIRVGRKDATDEEVIEAARLAECDEFVQKLPEGYDTVIGENGELLSGGQRQRISIARAMLKDANVILLDEATSFLDVENESKIQKALSELIKNKTVIIIAHRMRTIANADKIIVLDDGKISEQGSPDELLAQNGLFKKMVDLQNLSGEWQI